MGAVKDRCPGSSRTSCSDEPESQKIICLMKEKTIPSF